MLRDGLTPDQLRGMLLKQAEVEQRVAAAQACVARIAVLVRQIEQEDTMPAYDVALKTAPALLVAARPCDVAFAADAVITCLPATAAWSTMAVKLLEDALGTELRAPEFPERRVE